MFHDPNDLALILVVILPFVLSTVLNKTESPALRALSVVSTIPIIYCIFLTDSRGGWLAFGVMGMVFLYLHLRNKKFAIVCAVVALPLIFAVGPSRMQTISADEGAGRGRLAAWGYGNRMLKQWPLFGAGKGRFTEFSDESREAHNSFVKCWAELGLFGYFFWLGLIVASLKDGYALSKVQSKDPDARELSRLGRASVAGMMGFLAAAFFLSRTYHQPLYVVFGLLAALRGIYERDFGKLTSGFVTRDCRYVLAAELLSIPALYLMVRVLM